MTEDAFRARIPKANDAVAVGGNDRIRPCEEQRASK
jgi:hypothetical protein